MFVQFYQYLVDDEMECVCFLENCCQTYIYKISMDIQQDLACLKNVFSLDDINALTCFHF